MINILFMAAAWQFEPPAPPVSDKFPSVVIEQPAGEAKGLREQVQSGLALAEEPFPLQFSAPPRYEGESPLVRHLNEKGGDNWQLQLGN